MDTYGATSPKSKSKDVLAAGIETTVDDKHGTAHNKVMIIDSDTVVTGSFNFTSPLSKKRAALSLWFRLSAVFLFVCSEYTCSFGEQ